MDTVVADRGSVAESDRGWVSAQVWFGPDERPLFGHLVTPATGPVLGGVVLCLPMGEEGRAAHRAFRRLAEALADVGLAALRFDYDGTGDSAGAQEDPERVAAWLASVEAARTLLRERGVGPISAVGMRLGATIAARQALVGGGFESLVLWDPCVSGRTFIREGQALYAFSVGVPWGINEADQPPPDDGYRYTPGFRYDAATAKAMRGLDLGRLPQDARLAERLLVLVREDRPDPALARLSAAAPSFEERPALDQEGLLDREPSDNLVPTRSIAEIAAWMRAGAAPDCDRTGGRERTDVPELSAVAEPVLLPSAGAGSALVRERGAHLGPVGLFGIVTEPVQPVAPGSPWVVLLNVAAEHHIGPGRRWVEFAREWAAGGIRCVRIDQSGVGDSPVLPGQVPGRPYSKQWLTELATLVDELRSVDGASIGLVGLCSGGNSAFEAALRTRVEGVFVVNPAVTLYAAASGGLWWDPDRRAASIPIRPIARIWRANRRAGAGLWRLYRQLGLRRAPLRILAQVRRRGTTLRVMCGHNESRDFVEVVGVRPLLWWLRRRGAFTLDVDPTLDHSLLTHRTQELARAQATDFVHELVGAVR